MASLATAVATVRRQVNALRGAVHRPGGEVVDDMGLLVPAFRARVESLLIDLTTQGFDPRVFETLRSPDRCEALFRKGTGSLMSMHRYGVAVDIVSASKMWRAPRRFWLALQRTSERHGLVSGAAWRRHDLPHVQCIPLRLQTLVRASTPDEIARLVERLLRRGLPS